jgi:predicted nucleotidyltransferase
MADARRARGAVRVHRFSDGVQGGEMVGEMTMNNGNEALDAIRERVAIPDGLCFFGHRGSIAHNMFVPATDPNSIDDVDLIGFVIGTPENYFGLQEWGSRGTKEVKQGKYDAVFYELRKAFALLLQGNPNIISALWMRAEDYIYFPPVAQLIVQNRSLFNGRHIYNAFAGYAHAQLEKMETRNPVELREYLAVTAELKYRGNHPNHKGEEWLKPEGDSGEARDASNWDTEKLKARLAHFQRKGENLGYMGDKRKRLVLENGYDSKNAAHCIRLLRMCKEYLETGEMIVYRNSDAVELLDIKRGKWKLSDVKQHAADAFEAIRTARDRSGLPEKPDYAGAERLLVEIIAKAMTEAKEKA